MKLLKTALIIMILAALPAATAAQTKDLGLSAYSNESGAILMAVDAAFAVRSLDSPYVMFMAFFAAKGDQALSVAAKEVVMVYKGQEYRMPSLSELRDEYRGEIRDLDFYKRLGREGLNASWIRFYKFVTDHMFFPPLTLNAPLASAEGHMAGNLGFMTPLYFKNPGFAKGDKLTIKVRDAKNPDLTGECDIVLK